MTCERTKLGNGECDEECNNRGCAYDYGDCLLDKDRSRTNQSYFSCRLTKCKKEYLNDGFYDYKCAIPSCGFDLGDC